MFRIMVAILPMTLLPACFSGLEEDTRDKETILNLRGFEESLRPSAFPIHEDLPNFLVTNVSAAQTRFGGSKPAITNMFSVVQEIETRAGSADLLFFTDARSTGNGAIVTPTCSNISCSFSFPGIENIEDLVFSLDSLDVEDLSLINNTDLFGYDSRTAAVMTDEGVTLLQSRAAARQDDYTKFTFQSYGGWIGDHSESVFGLERITISQGARSTSRDAAFSFGDPSGTNPTGTSRAVWRGVVIGTHAGNDRISQGIAEIDIDDFVSPSVDLVISDVLDINSQSQASTSAEWNDMSLTDGIFRHNGTAVVGVFYKGSFHDSNHEQVGGVVNDRGWIGAFGGTRQATTP